MLARAIIRDFIIKDIKQIASEVKDQESLVKLINAIFYQLHEIMRLVSVIRNDAIKSDDTLFDAAWNLYETYAGKNIEAINKKLVSQGAKKPLSLNVIKPIIRSIVYTELGTEFEMLFQKHQVALKVKEAKKKAIVDKIIKVIEPDVIYILSQPKNTDMLFDLVKYAISTHINADLDNTPSAAQFLSKEAEEVVSRLSAIYAPKIVPANVVQNTLKAAINISYQCNVALSSTAEDNDEIIRDIRMYFLYMSMKIDAQKRGSVQKQHADTQPEVKANTLISPLEQTKEIMKLLEKRESKGRDEKSLADIKKLLPSASLNACVMFWDPNVELYDNGTLLTAAITCRDTDVVALLLKSGADVNLSSPLSTLPLITAVELAKNEIYEDNIFDDSTFEIIKLLLKNGANPDLRSKFVENYTPRERDNHAVITRALQEIEHSKMPLETNKAIMQHIESRGSIGRDEKSLNAIKELIPRASFKVGTMFYNQAHDDDEMGTLLYAAVCACDFDVIALFIEHGANVNHSLCYCDLPLSAVVRLAHNQISDNKLEEFEETFKIIKLLLSKGAEPDFVTQCIPVYLVHPTPRKTDQLNLIERALKEIEFEKKLKTASYNSIIYQLSGGALADDKLLESKKSEQTPLHTDESPVDTKKIEAASTAEPDDDFEIIDDNFDVQSIGDESDSDVDKTSSPKSRVRKA